MMRAQLIELTPDSDTRSRKAWSLNMSFTSAWQSSKLPSMASAWTFFAADVVICRCCTGETRPFGNRMKMSVRSRPAKASIAAPPVSPEVAPAIVARDAALGKHMVHQPRQQLHRHVLEGQRRAVEEFEDEAVGGDLDQRADRLVTERRIGLAHHPLETCSLDLAVDERAEHADRQVGIGKPAHGADLGGREFRPLPRNVKAAVAGKTGQKRVGKAENGRFAPGTHILHRHLSVAAASSRKTWPSRQSHFCRAVAIDGHVSSWKSCRGFRLNNARFLARFGLFGFMLAAAGCQSGDSTGLLGST